MDRAAAGHASEIFDTGTSCSLFANFAFLPLVFHLALSVATAIFCTASFSLDNVLHVHLPVISCCARILSAEGPCEGTGLRGLFHAVP